MKKQYLYSRMPESLQKKRKLLRKQRYLYTRMIANTTGFALENARNNAKTTGIIVKTMVSALVNTRHTRKTIASALQNARNIINLMGIAYQ